MKAKPTWTERLHSSKAAVVKPVPINIAGMKAGQVMLVPSAELVDATVRAIPRGQSLSVQALRQQLAQQQGAEVCCPITTGFHIKTVAEAAFEAFNQGTPIGRVTPVWRVLDAASPTLRKLSFDTAFIAQRRALEKLPP